MGSSITRVAPSRALASSDPVLSASTFIGEAILTGTSTMPAMERSTPLHDGLAYALWLPDDPPPWPAVVVVHGAGSRKENHADFARLATASGWAALTFDLPGHGESEPEMSAAAMDAVISMAHLLEVQEGVDETRVAVRGSSLGGFLALCAAAADPEIAGVIAICPAGGDHLARGVRQGRFEMRVGDPAGLEAWLLSQ